MSSLRRIVHHTASELFNASHVGSSWSHFCEQYLRAAVALIALRQPQTRSGTFDPCQCWYICALEEQKYHGTKLFWQSLPDSGGDCDVDRVLRRVNLRGASVSAVSLAESSVERDLCVRRRRGFSASPSNSTFSAGFGDELSPAAAVSCADSKRTKLG